MECKFEQFSNLLNDDLKDQADSIILFAVLSNLRISCWQNSKFLTSTIYIVIPFYNTRQFLKIHLRNIDNKAIKIIHEVEITIEHPQFKTVNIIQKEAMIKDTEKSLEVLESFKSSIMKDFKHLNEMGLTN